MIRFQNKPRTKPMGFESTPGINNKLIDVDYLCKQNNGIN